MTETDGPPSSDDPHDNVASLVSSLFKAPSILFTILLIVAVSLTVSPLLFGGEITGSLIQGIAMLAMPALGAAILSTPLARLAGHTFSFNRSGLLALICLSATVVFACLFWTGEVLGYQVTVYTGIAAGAGFSAGMRMLVTMGLVDSRATHCTPVAVIQPVLLVIGMWAAGAEQFLPEAVAAILICGTGGWFIPRAIDIPIRREFGVSSLSFVRGYLALVAFGEREIDEFFEPVASENDLPLGVFAARKPDGSIKTVMVVPGLHPGPFGTIGGGELPARMQRGISEPVVVFHGTCNHDQNPVNSSECDRLTDFTKDVIEGIEYGGASRSVRAESGGVSVLGQRFGDSTLLVTTLAPHCTEDVELGIGLAAMEAAIGEGLDNVSVVDAHNSITPASSRVAQGEPVSYEYVEACRMAARELSKLKPGRVKLGFAARRPYLKPEYGVGDLGLSVVAIDVGGQRTAYVNIDGNNMVEGLRGRMIEEIGADFDNVEVTTSDSHVGNTITKTNFVGDNLDSGALTEDIKKLCRDAIEDLENVDVGGDVRLARGMRVLGSQKSSKFAGVVAGMRHMVWSIIFSVGLACTALSAIAFALL